MGPVMLKIKHGNLVDDWIESCRNTVDDYIISQSKMIYSQANQELCVNENWIRDPPNVLFFALPRLNYDRDQQRLVKDLSEFQFDKVIYADRMLEANQGRISAVYDKTQKWQDELKKLRKSLEFDSTNTTQEDLGRTAEFVRLKIAKYVQKQQLVGSSIPGAEETKEGWILPSTSAITVTEEGLKQSLAVLLELQNEIQKERKAK